MQRDFIPEEGKPLYQQVATWLMTQVSSGQWPIHFMLPPEVVLAQELGISRVTLRKAMSDLVNHGLFTRISGRGTYVAIQGNGQLHPSMHAGTPLSTPSTSETKLIGVVVPSTTSPFVSAVLAHLEYTLYERGFRMLLTNSQNSLALQGERLRQLVDFGVAGIALYSGAFFHDETVNWLTRQRIPLVMFGRHYPAIATHVVDSDNVRGAYMATEHLLRLGHRRIGFIISGEIVTSMLARFDGYKSALKDYGVLFRDEWLMSAQIHEASVSAYLHQAPNLTAAFAGNDTLAIELSYVLRALKLKIPQDLALVGFDDLPLVSRLDPPLTTVAQNVHQLGEATANLLIETIEGRAPLPKTITIPTELIIRQSCGAPLPQEVMPTPQVVENVQHVGS